MEKLKRRLTFHAYCFQQAVHWIPGLEAKLKINGNNWIQFATMVFCGTTKV